MARARRRTTTTSIVRVAPSPRPYAPVIKLNVPRSRAATVHHKKHRRHHRSSSGGPLTPKHLLGVAIGGAVYGFIEKKWGPNLPTIPIIGKAGTITVAAYFLSKRGGMGGGMIRDVAIAGAVVAGYQLGSTGKVSGDIEGELADQVHGLAAQV